MELHQDLDAFLPRLHEELQRAGMSEKDSAFVCLNVRSGVRPRPIKTLEEYQDAWLICNAMENILTTLDDGSEAAAFCIAISTVTIDFEDAFHAKHGYWPLNAGSPEITHGASGTA